MSEFVTVTCARCDIPFGIPESYAAKRQQDGEPFLCPQGHAQRFPRQGGPDLEGQIIDLKAANARLEEDCNRLAGLVGDADKARNALEQQITELSSKAKTL